MKKYKVFTRFVGDSGMCANEIPAESQSACRYILENMLGLVAWKFHKIGDNEVLLSDGTTEKYE